MQIKLIGVTVRRHMIRNDIHTGHLVFLLPLHPPVLKPNLYLPLRQAQGVGHLYPSPSRQVVVRVELLLEFEGLVPGVGLSTSSAEAIRSWKKRFH